MHTLMRFDAQGWLSSGGRIVASDHWDERPQNAVVDLVVIHNISLPAGCFGGPAIEALFTGQLDCASHSSFSSLQGLRVSSHFLVRRDGEILQFVSTLKRAWHAGVSAFQDREACNDFSVGIELEGSDQDPFEPVQIEQTARLIKALCGSLPSLQWIAGHSDIAPGRKTDPGPHFDWPDFLARIAAQGCPLQRPIA